MSPYTMVKCEAGSNPASEPTNNDQTNQDLSKRHLYAPSTLFWITHLLLSSA